MMTKEELLKKIEEIDKLAEPPDARAARVFAFIKTHPAFTNWDVICFCAYFLGGMSMTPGLDILEKHTKLLVKDITLLHYFGEMHSAETTKDKVG